MIKSHSWDFVPFDSAVVDATGGQPKVQKRDYLSNGVIPVIDQGQTFIAGYTNDESMLFRGSLPVVLFGDHTRIFKYVDFPFALGADGVKVLRPRDHFEAKFLYFYFQTIDVTSRGYSRHFKYLKESTVPSFPPSEQLRIIELLNQADALRKKRVLSNDRVARIPSSLFLRMFGDPTANPKGWKPSTLGSLIKEFRYGTSVKCDSDAHGLPVLRIPNVVRGELDLIDLKYAKLPESEIRTLKLEQGDILVVRTNGNPDYVGRCSVFDRDEAMLFASYLIRARPDLDKVNPWYITSFLQLPSGRRAMSPAIRTTAGQSNINIEGLKQINIPLPPRELQINFADRFIKIRHITSKSQTSGAKLSKLFNTLLHCAFTGELTAKWRESHMKELLTEMEMQRRELESDSTQKALSF